MTTVPPAPADRSLRPLFVPSRVAVVGASDRDGSPGNVVWRNLQSFAGDVVPVSPTLAALDGVTAYPTLREVPGRVDLAVVVAPAAAVLGVVEDAAASAVGACVVVSGGFAETGEVGRRLQARVVAAARAGGVLLAGPNCLGVQNPAIGLNASLAAGSAEAGGIALVTQSGSYAVALHALSDDDAARFSVAYSAGNRADLADAEVLDFLREQTTTRVVAGLVESITDGPRFLDAVRRLTDSGRPVVLAPLGRSEAGARSAASHTAALARRRRVWDDLLTEAGVTVVRSGQEMLDAARVLHDQPRPGGSRVGIVTNSGGTGTELADLLADQGLTVPALSPALSAELAAVLPAYASPANPVDITPVWTRFVELYPSVVSMLAGSGEVDVVVPVLLHRSASPEVSAALVAEVGRLRRAGCRVPVAACWVAPRAAWSAGDALRRAGVTVLDGPVRTALALGHLVRDVASSDASAGVDGVEVAGPGLGLPLADDPAEVARWLSSRAVPMTPTVVVDDVDAAVRAAEDLGPLVVAKVVHPDLTHKSDVDGVRLNLAGADAVRRHAAELLALRTGARVAVQAQQGGVELFVGALRDPTFGPVVAFGAGGVLVELLDEVVFARAPLSRASAASLVARARCTALLDGFRGGPPVAPEPLLDLLVAVGSLLPAEPDLATLDLNPVLAGPHGCIVVDARLTRVEDAQASSGLAPSGPQGRRNWPARDEAATGAAP